MTGVSVSIFRRIAAGYLGVLLVLLTCGGLAILTAETLRTEAVDFVRIDVPTLNALSDVTNQLYREEAAITTYRDRLELGLERQDLLAAYEKAKAQIQVDLTTLQAYAKQNPQVSKSLADLKASIRYGEASAEADIATLKAGKTPTVSEEYALVQQIETAASQVQTVIDYDVKVDAARAQTESEVLSLSMAAIFVVGILVAAAAGVRIARSISRPLEVLTASSERIAAGEVIEPPQLDRRDEIGTLSRALSRMVHSLRDLAETERALRVDVAEYRRVQDQLQQEIQVRHQAEERLRLQADELQRSNAELEQFAYVASHDLQEPLRMVSSYAGLLKRRYQGKLDADADEFIGFAVDGVTRMQGLINDLLTYSRAGREPKPSEPTDSNAALDRALRNLKGAIEEKGALVTHGDLPSVMANPLQLSQLFQNLIGNAIKFCSDRRPEIRISAEQTGREWTFCVRDNGIGIDPQYADRIFLIFQRLHKRDEYPGTGIGLAICKKIVERHGGRIWVESRRGEGAAFYFTFRSSGGQQLAA